MENRYIPKEDVLPNDTIPQAHAGCRVWRIHDRKLKVSNMFSYCTTTESAQEICDRKNSKEIA